MQLVFVVAKRYLAREWLGIMYISALLKRHEFPVKVLPADVARVRREVEAGGPTVLAYSAPTFLAAEYVEFNRAVRRDLKGEVWSVFGGPHPTYYPEMIKEEGVDAICRGEGEEAALEFLSLSCATGRTLTRAATGGSKTGRDTCTKIPSAP